MPIYLDLLGRNHLRMCICVITRYAPPPPRYSFTARTLLLCQLTKMVHVMPKGALLSAATQERVRALRDDLLAFSTELEQARFQVTAVRESSCSKRLGFAASHGGPRQRQLSVAKAESRWPM